tara:strand:+ start:193 stop:582 length:390 start_codon:yes stop_codon:yes gene_type:complete
VKQSNLPLWTHIGKIISCYLALLRKKILHKKTNDKILHKKDNVVPIHGNGNGTATHVKQFLKEKHNDMFNLKKYYSDKTKDELLKLILLKNRQLLKADDEIERLNKVKIFLQKKLKKKKEWDDFEKFLP